MNERLRDYWFPKCLFLVTLGLAAALAGAVLLVPWFASEAPDHPLIALYAQDPIVRRVSLAAAAGLTVTAFVFFRPTAIFRRSEIKQPEPAKIAGA